MGQLGFQEILVIFIIALLVFGPKKLPELGKSLGKGIREFKRATDDLKSSWEDQMREVENPIKEAASDLKKDLEDTDRDMKAEFYSSHSSPQATGTDHAVPKEQA